MSKGILLFARNNDNIDYIKQAYFLSKNVKKYLKLPVTIVTDSPDYLKNEYRDYNNIFDRIISIVWKKEDVTENTILSNNENHHVRTYRDGTLTRKKLEFKNGIRTLAYDLSPYDETIILDTDMVLLDDSYLNCFEQNHDFLIYQKAFDLAGFRDYSEFDYISDAGITFYWATAVFFRKSLLNKIFFDLLKHVQENYEHYRSIFQINSPLYRNDYVFSIAIHIMNGFQDGNFAGKMPGKLFYTTDKDICYKLLPDSVLFLLEKEKHVGEYTLAKWSNHNIHVMNKFSLNRCIDKVLLNG